MEQIPGVRVYCRDIASIAFSVSLRFNDCGVPQCFLKRESSKCPKAEVSFDAFENRFSTDLSPFASLHLGKPNHVPYL